MLDLVIAAIGSGSLLLFAQFLIERRDRKKGQLAKIIKQLDKQERDSCRTQMLLLMKDYPEEKSELFTIAEHYFKDLHGNWYMTTLFKNYLKENDIEPPLWFMDVYRGA